MKSVKLVKNNIRPKQTIIKMRESMAKNTAPFMEEHVALREKATQGWSSRNKPKITPETLYIRNTNRAMAWKVWLTAQNAQGASVSVYRLLADGTAKRRAKMTFPYYRKTKPGKFGKFGVGGQVAFVSKRFSGTSPDTGKPGITERNWDEIVAYLLEPKFRQAIYEGGQNGLR